MSFQRSRASWEWLAHRDPLWAICTEPEKKGRAWKTEEFFETGEREISTVLSYLTSRGIEISDRTSGLDFGCGVGRLTRALSRKFDVVCGVDVSPTMVRMAQEFNAHEVGRMRFVLNEAQDLQIFADREFSFIYSSLVLQHIPYPASHGYLREFLRVLKPGGVLVFQTPTLDRTAAFRRLARTIARRIVQISRLPLARFHMEMNVIPEEIVNRIVHEGDGEVLDSVVTDTVETDGPARSFYTVDRGQRMVIRQFVVRKR